MCVWNRVLASGGQNYFYRSKHLSFKTMILPSLPGPNTSTTIIYLLTMGNALHTHRHGLQYICQPWPLEIHRTIFSLSLVEYQFKYPRSRYDRGADRSPILLLLPYLFILVQNNHSMSKITIFGFGRGHLVTTVNVRCV